MRIEFIVDKGFAKKGTVAEVETSRAEQLIASGYAVEAKASVFNTNLQTPEDANPSLATTADAPAYHSA